MCSVLSSYNNNLLHISRFTVSRFNVALGLSCTVISPNIVGRCQPSHAKFRNIGKIRSQNSVTGPHRPTSSTVLLNHCFTKSSRKETLLITPTFSENFVYSASSLWNVFRSCPEGCKVTDFTVQVGYVKSLIKQLIFRRQGVGDQVEWDSENFQLRSG